MGRNFREMRCSYVARSAFSAKNLTAGFLTLIVFALIIALSSVGAYLNRLRGGLWPHRNETQNTNYWFDHILPRMVVGIGSSAISGLFFDYRVSIMMFFQTWFSLYV